MKRFFPLFVILLSISLILTACDTAPSPNEEKVSGDTEVTDQPEPDDLEDNQQEDTELEVEPTEVPPTEVLPTEIPPTEVPPTDTPEPEGLPAERVYVSFQTQDGLNLEGFFYPSKNWNAPFIVLMHWAPGSMDDWDQIALWLQNRLDEISFNGKIAAASDAIPEWFPTILPDVSFNVLTFNFRGYGNSDASDDYEKMHLDALAAVNYASTLEGIDTSKIATIGASIGADGALDACELFNETVIAPSRCTGAFSLSPGSYIGMNYEDTVEKNNEREEPAIVYCASSEGDSTSWHTCHNSSGETFTLVDYEGYGHGMDLINQDAVPETLPIILTYLEAAFQMQVIMQP